ncbi:KH domain-containing protein [Candidatus Roizmanbacteria bacterium]|nr:MAG: KH domain-containing protein [Candidatus Roizmanbacteria bacterium]
MEKAEIIKKHTQDLLNKMVENAEVEVTEEEGMYHVNIKTDDEAPTVIGRHGETIRALQKILEVIIFKETGEKADLLINVNDYREKQIERLEYIADQAATKVQDRQSATYLRGFSSYERRIMHEYIAKTYPDLTSYSIGEGRDRRLVVDVARENDEHREEVEEREEDIKIDIE